MCQYADDAAHPRMPNRLRKGRRSFFDAGKAGGTERIVNAVEKEAIESAVEAGCLRLHRVPGSGQKTDPEEQKAGQDWNAG